MKKNHKRIAMLAQAIFLACFSVSVPALVSMSGEVPSPGSTRVRVSAEFTSDEEYLITFDQNGGSGGTESLIINVGEEIAAIEVPEKYGYDFTGYSSYEASQGGSGIVYFSSDGSALPSAYDIREDTTLYAVWKAKSVTVTYFDLQPLRGASDVSIVRTYGSRYGAGEDLLTPEAPGYSFGGWFLDEDYSEQVTNKSKVTTAEDHFLYALWEEAEVAGISGARAAIAGSCTDATPFDYAY